MLTPPSNYCIKAGYRSRLTPEYFEDTQVASTGIVHQPDVYDLAVHLARRLGCTHILDVGCGRGRKLASLHPEFQVIGIDFGSNIAYCRANYPFGDWRTADLEQPQVFLDAEQLEHTVIVCSDVIEHLKSPEGLLTSLAVALRHAPMALLSTPERDRVRGPQDMGPPSNPAHVREWNLDEFSELLAAHGLDIAFHGLTCNNDRDLEKKTILSILHGASWGLPENSDADNFRVVALMTAYNEEDVIYHAIKHLTDAGIEVYLIDNWSTDRTIAAAQPLLGKGLIGIEQFPSQGPSGTYDWQSLLRRVEELAMTLDADWFIHHDSDELRQSPWPELSLKQALRYVDRMGFNAVDHTVLDFPPVDNAFIPGEDFARHFMRGTFGRRPGHFLQIKAWKKQTGPVSLAATGGHAAEFVNRRVFPYKFLLRHYPIRSREHGLRKVLSERRPRYSEAERTQLGWHHHYDGIRGDHDFLHDPSSLEVTMGPGFYSLFLVERISGIGLVREKDAQQVRLLVPSVVTSLHSLLLRVVRRIAAVFRKSP